MIKIRNLYFRYGDKIIFKNINFTLNNNEKVGIVGYNGAGKTTFFNIIVGLIKVKKGIIEIDGKICREEKDFQQVRKKIGYVLQNPDYQLFSPTVEEDIAFGPLNLGYPHKEVEKKVKKVLEEFDIEKYKNIPSFNLSWGEKKIVSIAAISVMEPKLFLLDEPLAGLDEKFSKKVIKYFKNKKSLIITSHNKAFLKKFVKKIYKIENYKLKKL